MLVYTATTNVRYFTLNEDWKNNLLSPQKQIWLEFYTSNDCKDFPFLWSKRSTKLIVKRYKSIIFPLNIVFFFIQNIHFYSYFPAQLSEQKWKQLIYLNFLSSLPPSSPDWSPLQTWWSAVWWWTRWAARRSGSGRRWSWWRSASVPVLCCPSLETEMENDNKTSVPCKTL